MTGFEWRSPHEWRKAFSTQETIQRIRPAATDEYLNNPHMGWATFQRFNGDGLQMDAAWHDDRGPVTFSKTVPRTMPAAGDLPTSVAYCRWPWSVLEPAKGGIRYDILDACLATAERRGQTLQIRTQPFVHADLPKWFVETGAKCRLVKSRNGGAILEPDANDPLYIKHWTGHIAALARYDGHPALESVDVAYAGRFGEMGGNASPATAAKLVDTYIKTFKKTTLLLMVSTHGCRYAARLGRGNVGWRGDGFMDPKNKGLGRMPDRLCWNHMWDVYPQDLFEDGIYDVWKTAPVTMEPHATLVHVERLNWDIDWLLDACLKYHPSIFMHKSVPIPNRWRDKVIAFAKRLGYRFQLHQMILPLKMQRGGRFEALVVIDNKGIAPIYRPYAFALRFKQGGRQQVVRFKQDIRKWLPDYSFFRETHAAPRQLQPGPAQVACAIVNDHDKPVVRMAIKAVDRDGWHPLTYVELT